jgi:hypothetical protein
MRHEFLDEYEDALEQFNAERNAGRKDHCDLAGVFARYRGLFGRERVDRVLEAALAPTAGSPEELERVRSMARFAVENHIDEHLHELSDAVDSRSMAATVEWEGQTVPWRRARSRCDSPRGRPPR